MRFRRTIAAGTAGTAAIALLLGCTSKTGHHSGSTNHAVQAWSPCPPGDDKYSWCATPSGYAGGAGGVVADNAPEPQPPMESNPPPQLPSNNYSSGGHDCKFYSHPGNSGISLSQDGKTLYGAVQVTCDPLPKLLVVHVALYYLGPQDSHWRQVATSSVEPEPFKNNTVYQAQWPCTGGFFAVLMNATGTSATNEGFTAGATSEPLIIDKSECKALKK